MISARRMLLLAVLLLASAVGVLCWRASRPMSPNVLILLWDTVRADHLSLYGYPLPTSPRLDDFARDGVVFERASTTAVWTVPSHGSIFTGLPPRSHGATAAYRWLDDHYLTMAEWFGQHGYATYAFSANPNLTRKHINLLQGFGTIHQSWTRPFRKPTIRHTRAKLIAEDRSTVLSPSFPRPPAHITNEYTYNAGPVAHQAFVRWVGRPAQQGRPWLAYLSFMEAHKPRLPSMAARQQVSDSALIARALQTDQSHLRQLAAMAGVQSAQFDDDELEALRATYDASLAELDALTGELLDDLRGRGLLDNTIVVLTADHGELLGEHGYFLHKTGLYQPIVHVPLVIWWPKRLAARRETQRVSQQSLFATLNRLAGLPQPDTGLDRGDLLHPQPGPQFMELISTNPAAVEVLNDYPDAQRDRLLRTIGAVIQGDDKLIRYSDGERLFYSLGTDPHERRQLDSDPAGLDALLTAWQAATPSWDPSLAGPTDGPKRGGAARRAQLEALGYVEP